MSELFIFLEVAVLVLVAGVCSGLNIALMSLSPAELQRKAKLGNRLARRVLPFRRNSHLSLASILLVNVGAVSATSLVLENRFNGVVAGVATTLLMVILGEIFPQALFSRFALRFCGYLAPLLRLMVIVTYPVSKPLQLLLDQLFGSEKRQLQSRHELGLMITEHLGADESELDEDEVEIIRGALQLSEKQVRSIMTPIRNVFWLPPDTLITNELIDEIKRHGRSRIPIFDTGLTKCYGVVLMKDMVDIDFDNSELAIDDLPLHACPIIGSKTALDTAFRKFISAGSHLIPVEKDNLIVGIVTIEDLIEEILGHEIEDETDRRRTRKSRNS